MTEWQPIETAPRNGDPFIAYWDNRVMLAKWITTEDEAYGDWCGFVCPPEEWWQGRPRDESPSRWMPLPEPPA